jgi:hypothetical protein
VGVTKDRIIRILVDALCRQRDHWMNLPSGVDFNADASNTSPEDNFSHEAGLAVNDLDATLNKVLKTWRQD